MRMTFDVIPTGSTTATVILSQGEVDALRGAPGVGRVPLRIAYGDQVFRTSISRYRGEWMMVVNAEMRSGGLVPGAAYDVEVTRDDGERTIDVPADLAAALEAAGLGEAFATLSYTHRREHVRAIEEAKKPETRARRIDACLARLQERT